MRYINPKTDFAFKKIFGSPGSQGILRSFLNGVLYEGEDRIANLEIVDPYSVPRLEGMKDSYLDVRAVLRDGQHVIIEMQVLNVPGMEKRVLYNAAKEYSNQLIKGQDYRLLNPVIALTLTDFIMFPELRDQVISRFTLLEKNKVIAYPDGDVELVFVELPKFNRNLDQLRGLTDEWLYFVDSAADLDQIPERLSNVAEIEDAFHIAEAARLTPEEDHALELKTRWIADQKMILEMKLTAEAAAQLAQENAQRAEADAQKALADAQKAEADAQNARELKVQAEAKAEQAEAKAEHAEAKAEHAEAKAEHAEAKAGSAEARATALLQTAIKALAAAGLDRDAIALNLGTSLDEVDKILS